MSYLTDFPNTKMYDQDLGWLIREYKRLAKALADLEPRVYILEELYEMIPNTIAIEVTKMQIEVYNAIQNMEKRVDDLERYVRDDLEDYKKQFEDYKKQFNEMIARINALWSDIGNYVDSSVDYMQNWVIAYLQEWAKEYPYLVCPVDARFEPLQDILFHLYNDLSWGIPCNELDGMQLTCQVLDGMQIPVWKFDKWGRLLFLKRRFCYMFSPFTGEYVPISDVVLSLTRLHQNGVTCGELDAANIDVQLFDDKAVTAYDLDWTSQWFDELKTITI